MRHYHPHSEAFREWAERFDAALDELDREIEETDRLNARIAEILEQARQGQEERA